MKNLVMILAAAGLAVCPAMYASSGPAAVDPPAASPAAVADPVATSHTEAARTLEEKGDLARKRSNYYGALSYYLDALKLAGQNAMLYNKLGITELQIGNRGPARKYFGMALKTDPRNAIAFNNLGAVACTDGKYKLAVKYLKQALALDESDATAHLNLAEAWIGMGESDRAMTEYSRALELDADILSNSMDGVVAQIHSPAQRARISFLIAKAYAKRGNIEGALEFLRRAKDDHYDGLSKVYSEPEFASLVQDPRLAKIVKR
jgi:tetratricopeptide (TPR) repeat protein